MRRETESASMPVLARARLSANRARSAATDPRLAGAGRAASPLLANRRAKESATGSIGNKSYSVLPLVLRVEQALHVGDIGLRRGRCTLDQRVHLLAGAGHEVEAPSLNIGDE
jgi:hypothetical protein